MLEKILRPGTTAGVKNQYVVSDIYTLSQNFINGVGHSRFYSVFCSHKIRPTTIVVSAVLSKEFNATTQKKSIHFPLFVCKIALLCCDMP